MLIVGATTGIGEALARRFHAMGKKVIATGRNKDKLDALAADLKASLPQITTQILERHPQLDTVLINAGIQKSYNLFDHSTNSSQEIIREITTNLTAPNLLVQLFTPHLLNLAKSGTKTTIFLTSSGLAYAPLSFYPTYCATQAGIHAFSKMFRQQLLFAGDEAKNMNVVEIVPPYVDTGLDKEHRKYTLAMQGGEDKAYPPISLDDFINQLFENLEKVEPDGSLKKELGVGLSAMAAQTWRDAFEPVYQQMGLTVDLVQSPVVRS